MVLRRRCYRRAADKADKRAYRIFQLLVSHVASRLGVMGDVRAGHHYIGRSGIAFDGSPR